MNTYPVGIDISLWDPPLDWAKYTFPFVFIKVSEGIVIDPKLDVHWTHARGHTQRGGYHMFRAYVDPHIAAAKFLEYLDGDVGELPPVLDLEYADNIDVKTVVSRALTWLIEVEKRASVTPIVYSRKTFIYDTLKIYNYPDFARYPLWDAVYPYDNYSDAARAAVIHSVLIGEKALPIPPIYKPFKRRPYIQWTSRGSPFDVPGYYTGAGHKKAVDFNFQLEDELPPEPGGTMKGTVKAGFTLKVRNADGTETGKLLEGGDVVYGDGVNNRIYYQRIYWGGVTVEEQPGNSAVRDATQEFMTLVPGTDPIPAPTLPVINVAVSVSGYVSPSGAETVNLEWKPK